MTDPSEAAQIRRKAIADLTAIHYWPTGEANKATAVELEAVLKDRIVARVRGLDPEAVYALSLLVDALAGPDPLE